MKDRKKELDNLSTMRVRHGISWELWKVNGDGVTIIKQPWMVKRM